MCAGGKSAAYVGIHVTARTAKLMHGQLQLSLSHSLWLPAVLQHKQVCLPQVVGAGAAVALCSMGGRRAVEQNGGMDGCRQQSLSGALMMLNCRNTECVVQRFV